MARALHSDQIPINVELVRALVRRAMPDHAEAPVRRLPSSGSTNALFRLGDDLLVRLPRQPRGSATIAKEATWLPLLGSQLPVSVPDIVAMFEPDADYPKRWSVVRWIEGEHPQVVSPDTPVDPARQNLARELVAVLRSLEQAEGRLASAATRRGRAWKARSGGRRNRSRSWLPHVTVCVCDRC